MSIENHQFLSSLQSITIATENQMPIERFDGFITLPQLRNISAVGIHEMSFWLRTFKPNLQSQATRLSFRDSTIIVSILEHYVQRSPLLESFEYVMRYRLSHPSFFMFKWVLDGLAKNSMETLQDLTMLCPPNVSTGLWILDQFRNLRRLHINYLTLWPHSFTGSEIRVNLPKSLEVLTVMVWHFWLTSSILDGIGALVQMKLGTDCVPNLCQIIFELGEEDNRVSLERGVASNGFRQRAAVAGLSLYITEPTIPLLQ